MMRFEGPGMPGAVSRFNLLTVSRSKSKVREGWDSLAGNYQFVSFRIYIQHLPNYCWLLPSRLLSSGLY